MRPGWVFDVMGSQRTSEVVRALAVSAASAAVCLALSAAPAGAQAGSCAETPTLSFSSSSPLRVPVGGGSAKSPSLKVRCDGAPLVEPYVSVELVPDSVGVTFGQVYGPETALAGNDAGVVTLPPVTSASKKGSFKLVASLDGATASLGGEVVGTLIGLPPPRNPKYSLAIDQNQTPKCTGVHDYSAICLDQSVAMLNAGRRSEQLGPLVLPRNWERLTVPQQLFVLTDLERTARGLPPDTGLASDWNAAADAGAKAGKDPTRGGAGAKGFGSVWAGEDHNPIGAMLAWIYDDAFFPDGASNNLACTRSIKWGCWGHRDIELHDSAVFSCESVCAIGAAYSPTGYKAFGSSHPSYAEVFGEDAGDNPDPLVFTWTSELRQLPACERTGDACAWKGRPLLTAKGMLNVRGSRTADGGTQGAHARLPQPGPRDFAVVKFSGHGPVNR